MTVDSTVITADNATIDTGMSPMIIDGTPMVPIRLVAQSLGVDPQWIAETQTVTINTTAAPQPQVQQTPIQNPGVLIDAAEIPSSLKKGMTDEQFAEAYEYARELAEIIDELGGETQEDRLIETFYVLRHITDASITYSQTVPHYSDVYGFFVLNESSCAGSTRATALLLSILGFDYEHVNENQWLHQWVRVNVGGVYWICDPFGFFVGPEPAAYEHPFF